VTLVLDDATVRAVFDWKSAVDALREAYTVDPGGPASRRLAVATAIDGSKP
jgi:hypothetical protein